MTIRLLALHKAVKSAQERSESGAHFCDAILMFVHDVGQIVHDANERVESLALTLDDPLRDNLRIPEIV